jgi:glycosyltransferase involved in cell wall biosynthesis
VSVDIVIPAHNEAATIAAVVTACKGAIVGKVIVVCDACTDDTFFRAVGAGADNIIEIYGKDKGSAMTVGLELVTSEHVLFCDADLSGLTPSIIYALANAEPLAGQVVGLTESMINKWSKIGLPPITGERRLPTSFARTIPMSGVGYKVELIIDAAVGKAKLPHKTFLMSGVSNPTRVYEDPVGWTAMWADLGVTSLRYLPSLASYTLH